MIIRAMDLSDVPIVVDKVSHWWGYWRGDGNVDDTSKQHLRSTLAECVQRGVTFIMENDGIPYGVAIGILSSTSVWNTRRKTLHVISLHVDESQRKTMASGRLFKTFHDRCKHLLDEGLIDKVIFDVPIDEDLDLTKHGYIVTEVRHTLEKQHGN